MGMQIIEEFLLLKINKTFVTFVIYDESKFVTHKKSKFRKFRLINIEVVIRGRSEE